MKMLKHVLRNLRQSCGHAEGKNLGHHVTEEPASEL